MRIAVCDDDKRVLLHVLSQLADYREQRQAELFCQGFQNAVDLLASMEHTHYDLLFLDVLMPGIDGIQAAHEIRQTNENIKIVFLTSSPEYAVESYRVQATNYLLKPAAKESLFSILDQIIDLLRKPEDALTLQSHSGVFRLPYRKIEYIEVISKTLYFHLTDGDTREVYSNLSKYEPVLLAYPGFCKVHRSYLVNLNWVTEIQQGEAVTASGRWIPISRSLYKKVREDYMNFLFKEMELTEHRGGMV